MLCQKIREEEILAVNAELHSDLEQMLLENELNQRYLYGINIYYDNGEIEFDFLMNPPRKREAGYPRVGGGVADPKIWFDLEWKNRDYQAV